ncbi:MAG: hypothetical protein Tp136SUR676911_44 [Prokaryotic dsDNA virus sp.]|nr:MAG: hypothetical protein Tp136SUR676911_44 [Prokaryotic dsDNA virus sp.]
MELIKNGSPAKCDTTKMSEADIQMAIANKMMEAGITPRLEVSMRSFFMGKKKAVIDIVGFVDGMPVIAFEVKTPKTIKTRSKQRFYQDMVMTWLYNHGIPSLFVCSVCDAVKKMRGVGLI